MNILYISQSRNSDQPFRDPSVRYRCFNPAESLADESILADVTTIDSISITLLERYDLLVFHRPASGKKLEKLVNRAAQLGLFIIADYDDLIFNPEYAEVSPGALNKIYSLNSIQASFQRNRDALEFFNAFSVSTVPLKNELKKLRPTSDITVLHNYPSRSWLNHARLIETSTDNPKYITYLPGTGSHHHDFALVESTLSEYLAQHTDIHLRIVGPLHFSTDLFSPDQLEHLDYVPYPVLPRLIQKSWITIAPLAGTFFNNCKSGLKYFESAALGIPVVASPIDDMQRLKSPALHLASTPEDWKNAFEMLADKNYYTPSSTQGVTHVHATCLSSYKQYKEWYYKVCQH
jgi:glycosyltransferase involved in cell wall biosynthesis